MNVIKELEKHKCCKNCEHFFVGECRRFPPQIWETVETGGSNFPRVPEDAWCGEFLGYHRWVFPKGFKIIDDEGKEIGET